MNQLSAPMRGGVSAARHFARLLLLAALLTSLNAAATVLNWTNLNGGLWSNKTNWSPNAVPAVADDVLIVAPGTYTVTQDLHVTIASLTVGGASGTPTLTNAVANLTLNGASTINATAVFGLGAGALAAEGGLTVAGKLAWTGGTIGGAVLVTNNGTLEICGSSTKYLNGTAKLINYASIVWWETNDLEMGNSARIINQPGALFNIQNNQSISIGNGGAVTNFGTLRKSAGSGTTLIAVPMYNYGTLDVQSGVVAYGANSRFNDGTAFTGGGTNRVYAGTITFNGSVSSENLEIGGATIAGNSLFSGTVNWTGGGMSSGALTIATNGVLNLGGSTTKFLNGTGTLINYGSVVWAGTNDIETGNSARIINERGALFEIQNNQSISIANGGAITNLGTLRKSAGGGTTLVTVPLYNSGILDVQSGVVAYGAANQFNDGTAFTGGGTNLVYYGTITFNGAISSENLEIAGQTITGNGIFSGVVNWTGGDLSSGSLTIATNGVLSIAGSGTKGLTGTGTLINSGLITWSGTNDIQTANYARIINQPGALFEIRNNQLFSIWNGGAITNLGTLRKSAGGGLSLVTVPMYNFGTLDIESGSVAYGAGSRFDDGTAFTGAGTNLVYSGTTTFNGAISSENLEIAGQTITGNGIFSGVVRWTGGDLSSGSLTIATNGVLNIAGSGTKAITGTGTLANYGAVIWSGTNDIQTLNYARIINQSGALFDIQNSQSLDIWNGGAITNLGILRKSAGIGNTFIGLPLYNSGTVSVQSGTITIRTYTQTGGELSFGLNSLTNFGRLAFNNTVALTGTLGVNLNGGYIPVAGDAFVLITYPSRTSTFPAFDLPATHAWQTNASIYGNTALTLSVLNARPTLNPISQQTGDEENPITFTATASDPDPGQTWAFSLVDPPPGATINTDTGAFSWTPTEAQGPTTNVFAIQATDNGTPSLSVTQTVTVVVNEVNLAPALIVPPTQTLDELATLTVTNSASDPDIPANSLSFNLVSAPPGVNLDSSTGVLTWTPTEAQGPSTNTIRIALTDNGTPPLSATNDFTVIVLESNAPPVLAAIPDLTAIQDVLLLYTNSASDPDLPANSLTFDLVASPPGMKVDARSGVVNWTPSAGQAPSTNAVTLRVTDNGQPAKTDVKAFSVVAYPLPFLTITRAGTNVLLSWPAYANCFTLQQAADLKPPVFWADMTNAVSVQGGMNRVTNRADASWRCFRLHYGAGTSQPWLTIARSDASVIISWPLLAAGWSLYATTNLAAGSAGWGLISPPYHPNGANLQFTEPSLTAGKLYRLQQ